MRVESLFGQEGAEYAQVFCPDCNEVFEGSNNRGSQFTSIRQCMDHMVEQHGYEMKDAFETVIENVQVYRLTDINEVDSPWQPLEGF